MEVDDFLRHFARAAAAADRRYLRTGDPADVLAGLLVWEELAGAGGLEAGGPALVEARLGVAVLEVRRAEALAELDGLDAALDHLAWVRGRVQEGSPADLQARMALAAVHLQRFRYGGGDAGELDAAIAGWCGLLATDAGPAVAANLGRALLDRHARTGSEADARHGRALLDAAAGGLAPGHPALAGVRAALAAVP
jgi:hypothetical protein